jgi:hypothetical protein
MKKHHVSIPARTRVLISPWLRRIAQLAGTTPIVSAAAARLESAIGIVERAINAAVLRVGTMVQNDPSARKVREPKGAPPCSSTACLPPASGEEPPRTRPVRR